jgi:hypothetical protein
VDVAYEPDLQTEPTVTELLIVLSIRKLAPQGMIEVSYASLAIQMGFIIIVG